MRTLPTVRFAAVALMYCLTQSTAHAVEASCRTIELDAPGTPGAGVALYTQASPLGEDSALCWAAAAAQLVDFERARAGKSVTDQPTAPLPAAARAAYFALTEGGSGRDSIRNGYEYMALQAILKDGSCDQTLFGKSRRLYELGPGLAAYHEFYVRMKKTRASGEKGSDAPVECPPDFVPPPFLAGVPMEVLEKSLGSDSWVGALSESLMAVCRSATEPVSPGWGYGYASRGRGAQPAQMIRSIEATLLEGRPVMAAIDPDLGHLPGVAPTPGVSAGHVVLIVGQKVNPITGKCEALIRDSSVQVCQAKSRGGCAEPHHWQVPFDELKQQLYAITRMTVR